MRDLTNGLASRAQGTLQKGAGRLLGDQKLQVEGAYNDAKGRSLQQFGKAVDAVDRLIDKAPAQYRDQARALTKTARKRPLLTTIGVAGAGLFLAGLLSNGLKRR